MKTQMNDQQQRAIADFDERNKRTQHTLSGLMLRRDVCDDVTFGLVFSASGPAEPSVGRRHSVRA
jgi:hypothetical protein